LIENLLCCPTLCRVFQAEPNKTKTFTFRNLALFSPWLSVSLISETVKDRGYLSIYYQKLLTKSIQSKNLLLPGKEPDSLNECIWFRLKNSAQCRATQQVFYQLFTFKIIPSMQFFLNMIIYMGYWCLKYSSSSKLLQTCF
jgi:hypothetical protein